MASTTASEPESSPPPQPPTDIDVSGISTLVSWKLADGTTEYLQSVRGGSSSTICRPKLHLLYESASRSALIKLQLSILLKPRRNKSKNTAQFFMFVLPENIAALSSSAASRKAPLETIRNVLSADTVCLHFDLNAPPTVVAPTAPDRIVPKNEHSAGVLASLLDLARQTNITIYLPHRALDRVRLQSLCTAAFSHGLISIDPQSTATLYGGTGGRTLKASIIDVPSETGAADAPGQPAAESPPSYDELGPGPPPAVAESLSRHSSTGPPSRKRSRRNSSDVGSRSPSSRIGGERTAKKSREGRAVQVTPQHVDGMKDQVEQADDTELTDLRIQQMEQRLAARLDQRLDLFEQLVKDQIQEHKRNVNEMVEQRLDAHEEQTQTDLNQLRREVESDVEDQLIGKKVELDEQFRDEQEDLRASLEERFAELEESITERFSSARAVLEF